MWTKYTPEHVSLPFQEECCIIKKEPMLQKDITVLNMRVPNHRALKYVR